jgi:hypothetical protein
MNNLAPTKQVVIPAKYRPWQVDALKKMPSKKLGILVAHRRAGKTEAVCARIVLAALGLTRRHPSPLFAYIAPYLNQAKAVAWGRLKYYASQFPNTRINEADLTITLHNGSMIRIFGSDYPDRLRGLGFDGVVVDEVAQTKPDLWYSVLQPALVDQDGWALFIGTPRGQDLFYDLWNEAINYPDDWYSGIFIAPDTKLIAPERLNKLRLRMGENHYRREFLCDFSADDFDAFLSASDVLAAEDREYNALINESPLVMGVDVAAQGDDRSAIVMRRGAVLEYIDSWREPDTMQTVGRVSALICDFKPKAVMIDNIGLGIGVVDRLKQLGYKVWGINVGETAARSDLYANLKAECWARMGEWMTDAVIRPGPNVKALRRDLLTPKRQYDLHNKLKVESKPDLKKRVGFSTDIADALALTFARRVSSGAQKNRRQQFYDRD